MVKYYQFLRKTIKWTKKFVFYLMQMAMHNSFVLFSKFTNDARKLTLLQYQERTVMKLIYFTNDGWPLSGHNIDLAPDLPDEQRQDRYRRGRRE